MFRPARSELFRFRGHRLGLGHPAIGSARKSDLFADLVRGVVVEFGELPVVEDAEIVELLLDRAGHAGELFEIVGSPPRPGQTLEARRLRRYLNFFADRMSGSADVDAGIALRARNAIDDGTRHQVAVQRNGAAGVVIARHHKGDALGIGIGIDDGGNGYVEPLSGPRGVADDLKKLTSVSPAIEKQLNDLGIFHYTQIAELSPTAARNVGEEVGLPGRVEGWIAKAKQLTAEAE